MQPRPPLTPARPLKPLTTEQEQALLQRLTYWKSSTLRVTEQLTRLVPLPPNESPDNADPTKLHGGPSEKAFQWTTWALAPLKHYLKRAKLLAIRRLTPWVLRALTTRLLRRWQMSSTSFSKTGERTSGNTKSSRPRAVVNSLTLSCRQFLQSWRVRCAKARRLWF